MFQIEEYETLEGRSPFGGWFDRLDAIAAARITTAVTRLQEGKISNVKPVGAGVSEYKVDFGPGYRIYFGQDGERLIILLCGGYKKAQQKDIERAKAYWQEYKVRKRRSRNQEV
jgi:putative addiction module killer protein